MKIYLNEIRETETHIEFTEADAWVANAVASHDEDADEGDEAPEALRPGSRSAHPAQPRPIQGEVNLRQVDEVYVVDGALKSSIQLACSRCLQPVRLDLDFRLNQLYCKDPEMAGIGYLKQEGEGKFATFKPAGQSKGYARHAHDEQATTEDLDITYLSEDYIDLAEMLSEQIELQIPLRPLCKTDCKGLCPTCGTDLNRGRCACSKIHKESAFSALASIKIPGAKTSKKDTP